MSYNESFPSSCPPLFSEEGIEVSLPIDVGKEKDFMREELSPIEYYPKYREIYYRDFPLLPSESRRDYFQRCFNTAKEKISEEPQLYLHIIRLIIRLALYSTLKPPNGFGIDPELYLKYTILYGPLFAKRLKDIRQACMLNTLKEQETIYNEEWFRDIFSPWNGLEVIRRDYDYDSFLNEVFLIDWNEEADDFHWSYKPIEEDDRLLDLYKKKAETLLKSNRVQVEQPSQEVIATWASESISHYNGDTGINKTLLRKIEESEGVKKVYNDSREQSYYEFHKKSVFVCLPIVEIHGSVRSRHSLKSKEYRIYSGRY